MPTIEEWQKMNIPRKKQALLEGYNHMVRDISQRGDWRYKDSPLNRFKPESVTWGVGSSNISGGVSLRRIGIDI